jgi:hypothetical protein
VINIIALVVNVIVTNRLTQSLICFLLFSKFSEHVDFSVDLNIALAEHLASRVWKWMANCFGDDGALHFNNYIIPTPLE